MSQSLSDQLLTDIKKLEQRLFAETAPEERTLLIEHLLEYYLFVKPQRAGELLEEQDRLLRELDRPEGRMTYYRQLATWQNLYYQYDEAQAGLEAALHLVREFGSLQDHIEIGLDYCATLTNQQQIDKATHWLERSERLLKQIPDPRLEARALCRRGYLYLTTNRATKAVHTFSQAFSKLYQPDLVLNLRDHYCLMLVDSGMGRLFTQLGEPAKAIEAYQRALDHSQSLELRSRLAWNHANLGNALLRDGQYVKASHCFSDAIANEDERNSSLLAASIANLGFCYIEQALYEQAGVMLDQSESIYKESAGNEFENLATIEFYRARIMDEQGQLPAAIEHLQQAGRYADQSDSQRVRADVSRQLAELFAESGDHRSAYEAMLDYEAHRKESEESAERRHAREIESLIEAETREREAEHLKLQASQLQLRALRAQMNPHFLFNCLNSIQSFINTKDAGTAGKYLARFAMLMRQSLEYINLEYISLEDEIEFLSTYLDLNCNLRFDGNLTTQIDVDDELEEDIIGIPTMILQPYVENAVEHGLKERRHGHIQIDFSPYGRDAILAVITDDGVGRDKVAEMHAHDPTRRHHRGRGTEITQRRLDLLNRVADTRHNDPVTVIDLFKKDGTSAGTRVEVIIPFHNLS